MAHFALRAPLIPGIARPRPAGVVPNVPDGLEHFKWWWGCSFHLLIWTDGTSIFDVKQGAESSHGRRRKQKRSSCAQARGEYLDDMELTEPNSTRFGIGGFEPSGAGASYA